MTHNIPLPFHHLLLFTLPLALLILILRSLLSSYIFLPIANYLAISKHGTRWRDENSDKVAKFADSGFKLLVHGGMTYWGYR